MKMTVVVQKEFQPVEIVWKIETAEELHAIYAILNFPRVVDTIPGNLDVIRQCRADLRKHPSFDANIASTGHDKLLGMMRH